MQQNNNYRKKRALDTLKIDINYFMSKTTGLG